MIKNDVFGQKIYSKLAKNYTFLNYDHNLLTVPLNEEDKKTNKNFSSSSLKDNNTTNNENANTSNSVHGNKKSRKDGVNHSNYSNSNDGNRNGNQNQNQRGYKNYNHYGQNYSQARQQNSMNDNNYDYMYNNGYPIDDIMTGPNMTMTNGFNNFYISPTQIDENRIFNQYYNFQYDGYSTKF